MSGKLNKIFKCLSKKHVILHSIMKNELTKMK